MKKLLFIIAITVMSATSFAAKAEHDDHDHESGHSDEHADHDHASGHTDEHADEGAAHDIGQVSIANIVYRVSLHGEITEGGEAVVSIEAEQGQSPKEIRVWVGTKNGRGSVKSLLRAESHGHFHGHLEVPEKLAQGSAIWLGVRTEAGPRRGSIAIPKEGHAHE